MDSTSGARLSPEGSIPHIFKERNAVLFCWSLGSLARPGNQERLRSCSIVTTTANDLIAQIHDRMPVVLRDADFPVWLGDSSEAELKALLQPYRAEEMQMWEISSRVNSPIYNDPEIIEPVPLTS
jgi:Uncharacterized conserved protein